MKSNGSILLCTTNDNLEALRFYQRRGFRIRDCRCDAFREVLALKGIGPDTEIAGNFGIVIRDVLVLSKLIAL